MTTPASHLASPNQPPLRRTASRLVTYALFTGLAILGLVLEKGFHEMHVSKILIFSSVGVWARELPPKPARLLLVLVALLCLMITVMWFTYRHQHLVPMGHGVYGISNDPNPAK